MMPPPLEQKADAQLTTIWTQLQADETAYFAVHGRYWQGLLTHQGEIPHDGVDAPPDVGNLTPHDQPVPWPQVYIANPLSIACAVDMSEGPRGHGYVLRAMLEVSPPGGSGPMVQWARALAVGPEGGAHDWQLVPEPEPGMPG